MPIKSAFFSFFKKTCVNFFWSCDTIRVSDFTCSKNCKLKNDKTKLPLIRSCCLYTHRLCRRGNQCSRLQPDEGSSWKILSQPSLHFVICLHAGYDCNLSVERIWSLRSAIGGHCLHLLQDVPSAERDNESLAQLLNRLSWIGNLSLIFLQKGQGQASTG